MVLSSPDTGPPKGQNSCAGARDGSQMFSDALLSSLQTGSPQGQGLGSLLFCAPEIECESPILALQTMVPQGWARIPSPPEWAPPLTGPESSLLLCPQISYTAQGCAPLPSSSVLSLGQCMVLESRGTGLRLSWFLALWGEVSQAHSQVSPSPGKQDFSWLLPLRSTEVTDESLTKTSVGKWMDLSLFRFREDPSSSGKVL